MKKILCLSLCASFCVAQSSTSPVDVSPRVGLVEVFGAHKVSVQKIRSVAGVKIGDPLPPSEASEDRIDKISGIAASRLEAVCCTADKRTILYIGVEERDSPHLEFNPAPSGDAPLPTALYDDYLSLLEAVGGSIRGHNADEDLTNGYSLMADPYCRVIQQGFPALVDKDLTFVEKAVRESADPEQRAAAAYLLQYGPRGRQAKIITDALQFSLRDPEDIVRRNALRALRAIYIGAKYQHDDNVVIEPTWFVEMLNSAVFSDRRNASQVLVDLTEDRKAATLDLIRERALPSIIEMARWQTLDHALPAFVIAGRLAGFSEQEIKDAWLKEDRESVLSELGGKKRKK